MTELVEVTGFTASGNKWCNNSPITEPTDGIPLAYPAVITVSGYPNGTTVGNVNVILNGVSGASGFADQFLLVAPAEARTTLTSWTTRGRCLRRV